MPLSICGTFTFCRKAVSCIVLLTKGEFRPLKIKSPHLVVPGKKVSLQKIDAAQTGKLKSEADAQTYLQHHRKDLDRLQEVLYAGGEHGVLVVLQGMVRGCPFRVAVVAPFTVRFEPLTATSAPG